MTQITEHFTKEEFDRPERTRKGIVFPFAPYPAEWVELRLRPLCELLEAIRRACGDRPIHVGSGYRDPAYNKAIGGAVASQHMQGRAADIIVSGMEQKDVLATIREAYSQAQARALMNMAQEAMGIPVPEEPMLRLGGLGNYPGRFVHCDIRPTKRLIQWTGSRQEN